MTNNSPPPAAVILSPCIGICRLDERGYCIGCFRNVDEITRWSVMTDVERQHFLDITLPGREAS